MNRRLFAATLVIGALQAAVASRPSPASAQDGLDIKSSRDPGTVKSQLRMARQFGDKTLKAFLEEPSDGTNFFAPETVQAAKLTYAYIRAARGGIELIQSFQKYPDPVMALVHKRVEDAWNLSRVAASKITWGNGRGEFLAEATPSLKRAMQLIDQALVMMP